MDNDLSHAALIRFDNLNERLKVVEQQLGIDTENGEDGEDGGDSQEEGAYPEQPIAEPPTTSRRGRRSQTTTVEEPVEDTTTVSEY